MNLILVIDKIAARFTFSARPISVAGTFPWIKLTNRAITQFLRIQAPNFIRAMLFINK